MLSSGIYRSFYLTGAGWGFLSMQEAGATPDSHLHTTFTLIVQMSIFRKFVHIFTYCLYVHTLFTHQHFIAASQAIRRFGMGLYHCQSKIANKANAASRAI